MGKIEPLSLLRQLYDAAVERALPSAMLAAALPAPPAGRTVVIGAGKAAGSMALALEQAWPRQAPLSGLLITRDRHIPQALIDHWDQLRNNGQSARLEVVEASHPVPDARGQAATRRMMNLVRGLSADDLVICLISGGGSALLTQPVDGLTLADKQAINGALLRSGANIGEMNCVRKHLSLVKGGRLAALCAPAQVVTLAISDVPGDDPSVIASGPTVPDLTRCADALAILERYRIDVPAPVRARVESGELETPKPDDPVFRRCRTQLIATPNDSLQAAAERARALGLTAHILADDLQGESRDIGYMHAALARRIAQRGQPFTRPCVVLSGGETTVTVRSQTGRGGRALEFLMGAGLELNGLPGVWALAADTDGIDGTEEHAGGVLTPELLAQARSRGLSARAALDSNNVYPFFKALDALVVRGPTFTNVNDFRAFLIE